MSGDQLQADVEQYLVAAGMNVPPPLITSDPLAAGTTPSEQLLRVLGLAANANDGPDSTESLEAYAQRDSGTTETATGFAAEDKGSATAMAQQIPQLAASIAGAIAGAIGGALQPLSQLAQGATQAIQAGMAGQAGSGADSIAESSLDTTPWEAEFGSAANDVGGPGMGSSARDDGMTGTIGDWVGADRGPSPGLEGTSPTAVLGPAPVPSAGTFPSATPATPAPTPNATAPTAVPAAGMAGLPMIPPGAVQGAGGSPKDPVAETKRVSVATVKNGAPVLGRLITPPTTVQPSKSADGKPIATRRIMLPSNAIGEEPNAENRPPQ